MSRRKGRRVRVALTADFRIGCSQCGAVAMYLVRVAEVGEQKPQVGIAVCVRCALHLADWVNNHSPSMVAEVSPLF